MVDSEIWHIIHMVVRKTNAMSKQAQTQKQKHSHQQKKTQTQNTQKTATKIPTFVIFCYIFLCFYLSKTEY